jgi:hypothetical protein
MIAAIVLVIGLLVLGVQITDPSSNITLASELNIPPDQSLTDWTVLNGPIHFILADIPLAGLLLFAAGVIYWIADWLNEKLGFMDVSPSPAPAEREGK